MRHQSRTIVNRQEQTYATALQTYTTPMPPPSRPMPPPSRPRPHLCHHLPDRCRHPPEVAEVDASSSTSPDMRQNMHMPVPPTMAMSFNLQPRFANGSNFRSAREQRWRRLTPLRTWYLCHHRPDLCHHLPDRCRHPPEVAEVDASSQMVPVSFHAHFQPLFVNRIMFFC